ncbi:GNAT family N-acetyltransferase [Oscillatoria acuminata]|uniref:Acetyltransferase, ribosomal protein N-acetylase n=1 Tax=Oscillatoria acuminata PCC 6304 TaxID=56110 RepID=K9TI12_9CYAN|nr:GNAT family protein [Oscillatoria acuminata]AFY82507.1 acetyltransferase, ribosomal protein N-acetylase [Oscillatoria acuminata PCC 6304]
MTLPQYPDLPILESDRLILRKMSLEDAPDLFEYASDSQVAQYTTWTPHQSLEDSQIFLNSVIKNYQTPKGWTWGIVHKGDSKLIGTCGLVNWVQADHHAEIAYALSRPYWGQGYMPEAVKTIVAFGFQEIDLNRIEGRCKLPNHASAKVMEKVGFSFEGILRQQMLSKGRFHDMKLYAILREDWENLSVAFQGKKGV